MQFMAYAPHLLDTVNQQDPFGFWEGGFDPKKVVETMGYSRKDVADISHIKPSTVRYDARMPKQILEHMGSIANICSLVAELFDNDLDKTILWLNTQNPILGNASPKLMLRMGKYKKLLNIVIEAKSNRLQAA